MYANLATVTLARAHDTLVGRSLGEFVLRERIGEGGFGAVYRAIQPALDREAVIKVLHQRLNASKAAAERFLREAKLASKLDHPYAAHIYAFGAEVDGQLWIAMELVRGTPLDQVLRLQGPVTLERFVPLLDRICEVVHTAHEQGIIHRDLKPANVMVLARAGRLLPKLLDFGIAKGLASSDSGGVATDETMNPNTPDDGAFAETLNTPAGGLTVRGSIMGSPPYMAPEQWLDAGEVDARTDLYALGILAYECLVGRPPFQGQTITAIASAHANDAPPSLGARFPSALDKVLAKALAKEPAGRYPDALAFAAALRQASGIASETQPLPPIDPVQRDAAVNASPQPIAEAVAGYEASRNSHQGRDALGQLGRTLARYLGLLALACRSRVSGEDDAAEPIRTLYRRSLTDREWIALARQLTRPWVGRSDAYPIPELVGAFHDADLAPHLEALVALRDAEAGADDAMLALLDAATAHTTLLLEGLAFLRDYPLVVTTAGGYAERWMGLRRAQRSTIAVRGKGLAIGVAALLDRDGAPVLSLEPLFQIAAPTPGAPLDLFMFEGRDRRGAKLVALPSSFERHDDALWDWFRAQLKSSLDESESTVAEEKPPYRGLSAFSADDSAMFVGREKLVDAFANRLKLQPLLAIVGRSGAGKSSFIHAGVIPALSPGWRAITMRPGPAPLAALSARLEHAGFTPAQDWSTTGETQPRTSQRMPTMSNLRDLLAHDRDALGRMLRADAATRGPVMLVIDQLEELFTLCQDEDERKVFAEALAAAARSPDDPVRIVFTLRDDFLVRAEQLAALRNRIGQGLQILTVPAPEDLLRIVTEPARRVGYELEGDLATAMVKEVADQPGALALVSFTASKLWELRDRHFKQLTRSAYKTLGGVGGALAQHAEQTLEGMLPEERALTREAFRHLVTTQNTRAVLARQELRQLLGSNAHADGVIEKLVAARLLVTSENETGDETIEVIHEALLVTWPRLVDWRREDSEGTRFREQLRSAAKQWDERGRAKGLLWRGDALADFTRWRGRTTSPLTDIESAFTDASLADVARSRRNVRAILALAFAALGAVVVGLVFLNARVAGQRERAEDASTKLHDELQRRYEDQGREALMADDPLHALAYLDKARELGATGRTHDLLVAEALERSSGELFEVHHANAVRSPRFSSDGKHLITGGFDRKAIIWDAATGAKEREIALDGAVLRASFSPDDETALVATRDFATLLEASTGKVLHTFPSGRMCAMLAGKIAILADHNLVSAWELSSGAQRFEHRLAGITTCAVSVDGARVAIGSSSGTIEVLDARTGVVTQTLLAKDEITTLAFRPDGTRLVAGTAGRTATVFDASTANRLVELAHGDRIESAEFDATGTRIVTASGDRTAVIWDAATGARLFVLEGHTSGLTGATFSPDGTHVVTTAKDSAVGLWSTTTGKVEARWRGHEGSVTDPAFDRSGSRVVTASEDGSAIVWRVAPQQHTTELLGHQNLVYNARFSPSGARVVTASKDGTVRIWQASGEPLLVLQHRGASDATFSPDEHEVASVGEDGMLRIWNATTGEAKRAIRASADQYLLLAWSADGQRLATASYDGSVRCWDTATWKLRFEVLRGHGGANVSSVSFAPDGRSILTAGDDSATRTWDLDGKQIAVRVDPEIPATAAIDPTSGRHVVSTESRQRATIWDRTTGAVEVSLIGHGSYLNDAEWSPDSAYVVTSSSHDGTARIWDARSGDELLIISNSSPIAATFAPDGARIVIGNLDGRVQIYQLPRFRGTAGELAQLLRCRVPFDIQNDKLHPRERSCR